MKKTYKVALCGILSAMQLVILLAAYFPYLTYALPAIAGCLTIPLVIDIGKKYAFMSYLSVSILSVLMCEKEAMLFYIFFFGYYPILKAVIEQIKSIKIVWILKLLIATTAFCSAYFVSTFVLGINVEALGEFGKYTTLIMVVLYDIFFILYDRALSGLVLLYIQKYRKIIRKFLNQK